MSKPNPEVFAECVLWTLADIRARLIEVEAHLQIAASLQTGKTPKSLLDAAEKRRIKNRDYLFDAMKKGTGVNPNRPFDFPSDSRV